MKSWMRHKVESLVKFARFGHPYKKAMVATGFLTIVLSILGLVYLLPNADHTSIQAGLTTIAGILGVLLGAVLIVTVLLIERGHQAEELLRGAFHKYRSLVDSHSEQVNEARQQLIEQARSDYIQLDAPAFEYPSGTASTEKNRDVIANLSSLTLALKPELHDTIDQDLHDLGYSKDERNSILYGIGVIADYDPVKFLRLAAEALDLRFVAPYSVFDLACQVLEGYSHDGLDGALNQLERSKDFLRSKTLAAAIAIFTLTTVGATLALFGITAKTFTAPPYVGIVTLIVIGFIASVLLALLLIEKMFT